MKYKLVIISIITITLFLILFGGACDRTTKSYSDKFEESNFSLEINKKGDWRWDNGFTNYSLTIVFIPFDTTTYLIDFVSYGYRSRDKIIKQFYTNKKTVHIFTTDYHYPDKIIIYWSISNKVYKKEFTFTSVSHKKWKIHVRT